MYYAFANQRKWVCSHVKTLCDGLLRVVWRFYYICSDKLLLLAHFFHVVPNPHSPFGKKYSLHHPRFVAVSFPHLDCGIIGHSSAQICSCSARLDGECRWTAISGLAADFQLDSNLGSGCAAPEYQPYVFRPFFIVFAVCFESLSCWKMNFHSKSIAFRVIFALDGSQLSSSSWWKSSPECDLIKALFYKVSPLR